MTGTLLRLKWRLYKKAEALFWGGPTPDMAGFVDVYRRIWEAAAREIGAGLKEISGGVWKASINGSHTIIHNYRVKIDDPVVLNIAGNKPLCYRMMAEAALPVPAYAVYTMEGVEKAKAFMERFDGGYFVVKPSAGTAAAKGVTTHVRSFRECLDASALASLYCGEIMIERLIPGESYRILVLDGRFLHASRRRGLRVTGDGRSTTRALMEGLRAYKPGDRDMDATLLAQGLSPDTVLPEGRVALVKSIATERRQELCTFFDEDVTGVVCDGIKSAAVKAAASLGVKFAGVDVVTTDPMVPLHESGGAINEVNTTPGLHNHYNLSNGSGRSPAVDVLKYLLGIR